MTNPAHNHGDRAAENFRTQEEPFLSDGMDTIDGEGRHDVLLSGEHPVDAPADAHKRQSGRDARAAEVANASFDPAEIVLHGERLVVDKQSHEWARVKVTRRIVTEERTFTVPVRREELVVEYPEGARPTALAGAVRGSTHSSGSQVIEEYVLLEEVPQVELVTRERERVRLVVDTTEATVRVSDELSREQLHIDEQVIDPEVG